MSGDALSGLRHDGPPFRAPWEAQAFALTIALYERGAFTWSEWTAALAEEIARAQQAGDPDTGETYYLHWLGALERVVAAKGLGDADILRRYREAWRRAAQRTPHGAPIALAPADFAS
ncbi:MAG TPA: nitrile hydratase accessory protein [Stellaceae bacterium]|nr:nitrile hydratase accessory protein [Stellaceae bacterium]